jgi:hypothetical protein
VSGPSLFIDDLPPGMWWTLKTLPFTYFTEAYRWVLRELGLSNQLGTQTDAELCAAYPKQIQRKAVLRPLLIQNNINRGLAVPQVRLICVATVF